ncbi:MAG: hypothetical protein KAW09_11830 [Thermoplasmata archaeon]|nr:hypothetical protein [Thermoplasmata archaeon]
MAKKRARGKRNAKALNAKESSKSHATLVTESMSGMAEIGEAEHGKWNDLAEHMKDRISKNIKNQRRSYRDFYNRWMKFAEELGNRMSKTELGRKYWEANATWRDYANKINHHLTKKISKANENYEELNECWQSYSKSLGEEINKAASGHTNPGQFKDIYEVWAGFAGVMQEHIRSTTELDTEELKDTIEIWHDFSDKMGNLATNLSEDGRDLDNIADLWTSTSKEMDKTLQTMWEGNGEDFEELGNAWYRYCSATEKGILDTSLRLGVNYDDLWRWYFDNQKTWYAWWTRSLRDNDYDLRKEVGELWQRVESLEKR